jgi:putative transposase
MSRQNYYARRRERQRAGVDEELIEQLVLRERQVQPRIGGRKLHVVLGQELAAVDIKLGRDRFFKVLRQRKLLLERRAAAYPCTTNSDHYLPIFGNRIKELELSGPNQVWVSDVTYLRSAEGFVYLSLITDKWSRKVVGYHCHDTLEAEGSLKALAMALAGLPSPAKPIHHSDRGSQYCCHDYVNRLRAHNLGISMTETNHCAENALAERMNGILKGEYALDQEFQTRQQVRRTVAQAVHIYDTRRLHTALGYRTPESVHTCRAEGQAGVLAPNGETTVNLAISIGRVLRRGLTGTLV